MIRYLSQLPSPQDFQNLRGETNWGVPTVEETETVLARSLSGAAAFDGNEIIGMARCVGDGVLIVYIQDVIISENYRGQGIGKELILKLIADLETSCHPDCTIGLFAATGQASFYQRIGFSSREMSNYGPGMHAKLDDLVQHKLAMSAVER